MSIETIICWFMGCDYGPVGKKGEQELPGAIVYLRKERTEHQQAEIFLHCNRCKRLYSMAYFTVPYWWLQVLQDRLNPVEPEPIPSTSLQLTYKATDPHEELLTTIHQFPSVEGW